MATIEEKIQAQREYAKDHNLPRFAPRDGVCFFCGNNIYNLITLERAKSELITSCPYCNKSYCT